MGQIQPRASGSLARGPRTRDDADEKERGKNIEDEENLKRKRKKKEKKLLDVLVIAYLLENLNERFLQKKGRREKQKGKKEKMYGHKRALKPLQIRLIREMQVISDKHSDAQDLTLRRLQIGYTPPQRVSVCVCVCVFVCVNVLFVSV